MSSVAQLEAEISKGRGYLKKIQNPVLKKIMIDRALESVSAPYKLVMRIFSELCSSIRSQDIHWIRYLDPMIISFNYGFLLLNPILKEIYDRLIIGKMFYPI